MAFLYEDFKNLIGNGKQEYHIPSFITDNLKYKIRPYQMEAIGRYIFFDKNRSASGKENIPVHLLFNMATGSGKTLVIAGLMLYLFEKGYRNFLFFVNSNNIIGKTKDNFLNPGASKYLFANKIIINNKEAVVREINNFEDTQPGCINIKFTTIQQLHIDLNNVKENSVTYEDFKDRKLVLFADEAHHLSSATKNNESLSGSWEGTVLEILKQNTSNVLLEFTATLNYGSKEITGKYRDKIIFRYDLAWFRADGYSKEISLIRSQYDERERIIQALIINLYRSELAVSEGINLKPVILFKARRTIKESERNKAGFHRLIDELNERDIEKIRNTSTVNVVQKAFSFFNKINLSPKEIAKRIKTDFKEENCISANNDKEAELNQMLLNTLEDENNPVRAVFAVQKLNEGWDVLNLFDIVRLYDGYDGTAGDSSKTTISEAQLIGRGARYFPFVREEGQDPYKRKYDNDINNDFRVLEELFYHTREDNRYIQELKKALIKTGIYEENHQKEPRDNKLKEAFEKTDVHKNGAGYFDKKSGKNHKDIKSFKDLGMTRLKYQYTLSSGTGEVTNIFEEDTVQGNIKRQRKKIAMSKIPEHIIRFALSQNPFFQFANLRHYFPGIKSLSQFIESNDYLGGLEITFTGTEQRLRKISHSCYLTAVQGLLKTIEAEIKSTSSPYASSGNYRNNLQNDFYTKIG